MTEQFVLLVEDNPDDVELTLRAFRETGFPHRIVVAHDGKEALDFLLGRGEYSSRDTRMAPLLVMLDLNLPKVGGLEVLRRLRTEPLLRHLVAVVLTGSNEERDRAEAQALGISLYLRKADSFDDFTAIARQVGSLLLAFKG